MAGLEDLSDDVLYLVLGFLTAERISTLRCLRSTSHRLSLFADSELYRTVVLEEDNGVQEQASFRCIERLLDPADALRHQVRFLHVKSFKGDMESSCMNTSMLQECVKCIRKLDSFRWNATVALPDSLLSALRRHQSTAQLCVSVRQVKQEIAKSSQLHSLSISIPCSDITSPNSPAPFEQLRLVLIQNNNVRALSIDAHLDCTLRDAAIEKSRISQQAILMPCESDPPTNLSQRPVVKSVAQETYIPVIHAVQIPLQPTDQLPKLEELAFKAWTYAFDENHCRGLQRCIDWQRLKRLTLDCSNYGSFFDTFAYEKLQLEHLDVSSQIHFYPYSRHRPRTDAFSRFVSSLHRLRALGIRYRDEDLCYDFWPNLVRTHGKRLSYLSLKRFHPLWSGKLCKDKLWTYLGSFTILTVLELEMPDPPLYERSHCHHCSQDCRLGAMPYVPSLERLYVSSGVSANDEQSLHMRYTYRAHSSLQKLWSFYTVQPGRCNLTSVDLKFWRWNNTSPHQSIARLSGDMGSSEITFESTRCDRQLVVKERDERKVTTTYYDEIREVFEDTCIKVSYVATHHEQRERHR